MWKLVSFVRRGRLRTKVLESLSNPSNPTDLAKKLNSHRSTVSSVLSDLKKKSLVKRLNPSEKNVSIYGLTKEGKQVSIKIKDMK
ncbi:MAG: MarR family transcriptional regulator [archaeon]